MNHVRCSHSGTQCAGMHDPHIRQSTGIHRSLSCKYPVRSTPPIRVHPEWSCLPTRLQSLGNHPQSACWPMRIPWGTCARSSRVQSTPTRDAGQWYHCPQQCQPYHHNDGADHGACSMCKCHCAGQSLGPSYAN